MSQRGRRAGAVPDARARPPVRRLARFLSYLSPWIALGLAAALVAVYLDPGLLPTRTAPAAAAPAAAAPPADATSAPAAAAPLAPPPAAAAPTPPAGRNSYAEAVARAAPAVVNISTKRVILERQLPEQLVPFFPDWPEFRRREDRSLGSGVILDAAGYIATNHHVVSGAQEIVVQLIDGRSAPAELVGSDPETDLAILKVTLAKLPVMELGRSDRLRVGDVVLAIGNSLGLGQTVTQGIVSATGRSQLGLALLENFIQTDAAINQGNSGGALITATGEMVGINTAVVSRQAGVEGIGFAIPVNLVRGVAEEIRRNGRIVRGWAGVAVQDVVVEERGRPVPGVQVLGFYAGSPAAAAGLARGDVLISMNGKPVEGTQAFLTAIARMKPGAELALEGLRPSRGTFTVKVPIVERPPPAVQPPAPAADRPK
jgi:S1-C subfamily serine protease